MQKEHPPAASWDLGDSDHDSGNFTTPSSPFTILSMYFSLTRYVSITFISELIDTLCNVAREIWCNSSACCQDGIVTSLPQISRLNKKHNTTFGLSQHRESIPLRKILSSVLSSLHP